MSRLRVAIAVDNPLRDLPSCVLLATTLAARGATCFLVPLHAQARELPMLAPDALVLNYLRPNNVALAAGAARRGTALFVLDTEGGVIPDFETYDQTLARDPEARAAVTAYCAWGRRLGEHLVDAGWYRDDQVVVTGSPRFDFYASPWRAAALDASAALDALKPPFVLVNGNFPLANPRFQDAATEVRMLVERFGFDPALVEQRRRDQADAMAGLAALANRLAEERPETVIYRPHPFERAGTYDALVDARPNLHVVQSGTVDGWILRSVAVIQRSCTTAIEAALAGVPALDASWLPAAARMLAAEAVSRPYPTPDALCAAVADAATGRLGAEPGAAAALAAVVGDWFRAVDGHAHERVAATIVERTPAGRPRPAPRPTPKERATAGLRRWVPPEALRAVRTRRLGDLRDKAFTAGDVASLAGAVATASGREPVAVSPAPGRPFMRAVMVGAP